MSTRHVVSLFGVRQLFPLFSWEVRGICVKIKQTWAHLNNLSAVIKVKRWPDYWPDDDSEVSLKANVMAVYVVSENNYEIIITRVLIDDGLCV